MTTSFEKMRDRIMYDEAFQAACQRYANAGGSSGAIAAPALRACGGADLYDQLFLARDEVADTRQSIFECSTIRDDPLTLDDDAKPDIERLDAQLSAIDEALTRAGVR